MLVFGSLKRRKFQNEGQEQRKRRCYGCVIYIPLVCVGAFYCPMHTFTGIYTRNVGISLLVYLQWQFLRPQTTDDAKVQIPAFFCFVANAI